MSSIELGRNLKIQLKNSVIFQLIHLTRELQQPKDICMDPTLEYQLIIKSLTAQHVQPSEPLQTCF